jgi:DNA-3-methyladenine glycosylase
MLNIACEPEGTPAGVLIRAVDPLEGLPTIQANRPERKPLEWTSGPARLTMAFGVTLALNRLDMTTPTGGLWIEADQLIPDAQVRTGPRIGLGKVPEPWFSMAWRWWVGGNLNVSVGSGKLG